MVAVADGKVAEAARADRTRHGRGTDQGDQRHGEAGHDAGHCLRDQHFADNGPAIAAHGAHRLDQPALDLAQRYFGYAGVIGRRGDRQGNDCGPGADGCPDDQARHGNERDQQDDEGHGAKTVDDGAERTVDRKIFRNAAAGGRHQRKPQRQAEDERDQAGGGRHHDGFPERAKEQFKHDRRHGRGPPPARRGARQKK
ncbi:hypothetical protein D3C80_1464880 [compost metagenome]